MVDWIEGSVIENRHWNAQLCTLRIQVSLPSFEAGQFITAGLEVDGKVIARPYSLVNQPSDPIAEIYFNTVPAGPLSNQLFSLQPGDKILVSVKASGFFVLSEVPASKHLWLLATGTGIGPYLSMLRTPRPWKTYEKVFLVHGVKTQADLAYSETIQQLIKDHPQQLQVISAVTREPVAQGLNCRISDAIASGLLEQHAGCQFNPENSQVMLCGNPDMVNEGMSQLQAKGLKKNLRRAPGQITREIYQ